MYLSKTDRDALSVSLDTHLGFTLRGYFDPLPGPKCNVSREHVLELTLAVLDRELYTFGDIVEALYPGSSFFDDYVQDFDLVKRRAHVLGVNNNLFKEAEDRYNRWP